MIPKEIIEKAKAGGWKTKLVWDGHYEIYGTYDDRGGFEVGEYASIALDREFWICLGKTLGWPEQEYYCTSGCGCKYPNGDGSHERECVWKYNTYYWRENAKSFYDLVLNGSSPDEFWAELLPSPHQTLSN